MKTISIGAKLARLHSGIGNAIMSLAMARGPDIAVARAMTPPKCMRMRATKRGGRHETQPAGTKLQRGAAYGTLTVRHVSETDQYWRDAYAKRVLAARAKRLKNAVNRQANARKFAFGQ
jgi:hypothetical protein